MAHRALAPVPDSFNDATVAMLEPLGVALHCVDLGHVHLGSSAAVVGCGPIGLMLVQALLAAGASRVVAVEPLEHRRGTRRPGPGPHWSSARAKWPATRGTSTSPSKWPARTTPWRSVCNWSGQAGAWS